MLRRLILLKKKSIKQVLLNIYYRLLNNLELIILQQKQ
jgi:hypothetical protein